MATRLDIAIKFIHWSTSPSSLRGCVYKRSVQAHCADLTVEDWWPSQRNIIYCVVWINRYVKWDGQLWMHWNVPHQLTFTFHWKYNIISGAAERFSKGGNCWTRKRCVSTGRPACATQGVSRGGVTPSGVGDFLKCNLKWSDFVPYFHHVKHMTNSRP